MSSAAIRLLADGDPATGMTPSDVTSPGAFTGDDRTELNHTYFQTADESILTGVWLCAPCRRTSRAIPCTS